MKKAGTRKAEAIAAARLTFSVIFMAGSLFIDSLNPVIVMDARNVAIASDIEFLNVFDINIFLANAFAVGSLAGAASRSATGLRR
ncbi:protein of unknown function [Burkholderia multivorans]